MKKKLAYLLTCLSLPLVCLFILLSMFAGASAAPPTAAPLPIRLAYRGMGTASLAAPDAGAKDAPTASAAEAAPPAPESSAALKPASAPQQGDVAGEFSSVVLASKPVATGADATSTSPEECELCTSDGEDRPPKVNLQIDVDDDQDAVYLDRILTELEQREWRTTIYVAGAYAAAHPDVVRAIVDRGHELGVHGWEAGEDLTQLGYDDQRALIERAFAAVREAAGLEDSPLILQFKPQGFRQNVDTYQVLLDLGIASTVGIFPLDEDCFRCQYCSRLGYERMCHPYFLEGGLNAIPISEIEVEEETVFLIGTEEDPSTYLDYLVAAHDKYDADRLPMTVVIRPGLLGEDETGWGKVITFLDHVQATGGTIVRSGQILDLDDAYVTITSVSAPQAACPGSTIQVTVNYRNYKYCPTYYFRFYGRYPKDKQFWLFDRWRLLDSASYYVHIGEHTFQRQIGVPAPLDPTDDGPLTLRVVAKGCAGTCWPLWWLYESKKETSVLVPRIQDVIVEGEVDKDNPEANGKRKVFLKAEISTMEGSPQATWEIRPSGSSATGIPVKGNPVDAEYIPDAGTHGKKDVTVNVTWAAGGATCQASMSKEFNLFFVKGSGPGHWEDDDSDSTPNWFEYWARDGAVPGLNAADVEYDATCPPGYTCYGAWNPADDKVYIKDGSAETKYPNGLNVPAGANCLGGNFGGEQGIDACASTLLHERRHETVYHNWDTGGAWAGPPPLADSDDPNHPTKHDWPGDDLPDTYETNLGTSPNNVDSCGLASIKGRSYANYGDAELDALIAGDGATGNADNDWANPGKQTTSPFATVSAPVQVLGTEPSTRSGPAGPNAPYGRVFRSAVASLGGLTGNYSDAGVDTDGDGLYNYLKLSVGVQITETEMYNVVAWLEDVTGTAEIVWASTGGMIATGTHTVDLFFDGRVIRESGLDGPYNVARVELRVSDRDLVIDAGNDTYTTTAYAYTDFEPYDAQLSYTFNEATRDTDGDGLYDSLDVGVGLDIYNAGSYTVTGRLFANGNEVAFAQSGASMATGTQVLTLTFDGQAIRQRRQDGPYLLGNVRLHDASDSQVDFALSPYTTTAYAYTDFERGSAELTGAYSDSGIDDDGNGYYDYLRLSATVDVITGSTYSLVGWLYDINGNPIDWTSNSSMLSPGTRTMTLDFDGLAIGSHGVDGPYYVSALSLQDDTGTMISYEPYVYTTTAYAYTDFEQSGSLIGVVSDIVGNPVADALVDLSGPAYNSDFTDDAGAYAFRGLPEGSYGLLVTPPDPNLRSGSSSVYVSPGYTQTVDFVLQPAGSISGTVLGEYGRPITDAILYYSGYETPRYHVDENGRYIVPGLSAGRYTLNIISDYGAWWILVDGHHAQTGTSVDVDVALGRTTVVDFQFPPKLVVSPLSLSTALLITETATQTLTITNAGASPLGFEILERAAPSVSTRYTVLTDRETPQRDPTAVDQTRVEVPKEYFVDYEIIGSFPSPDGTPRDLAYDGTYLWHVSDSGNIYKMNPATGWVVETYSAPGGDVPVGLTFDGTYLWHSDFGTDTIYKIDPHTSVPPNLNVVDSFPSPRSDPAGLAWDGQYLWCAILQSGPIIQIDPSTGREIDRITTPGSRPFSLTYLNGYLYIGDDGTDTIYKMHLDSRVVVRAFPSPGSYPSGLANDGLNHLWNADWDTDTIYKIEVEVGGDVPWLSEEPIGGMVDAYSSTPVVVTFDAGETGRSGVHTAQLVVSSDDPVTPTATIPVTMVVSCPTCGTLKGTVTDADTGLPVTATISVPGAVPVGTDPATGQYSMGLPPDTYTMTASAKGYVPESRVVTVTTGVTLTHDFALLKNAPKVGVSPGSLSATVPYGQVATRTLTISNSGPAPLEFLISTGLGQQVSFFAASTELYGYDVPDAWLRVVGTQDDTHAQVINLATGVVIAENTDLDRYEIWDVYPSDWTYYKVEATKPVVGYESDLAYYHTTFIPSLDAESGPVGTEFIFYYYRYNYFYVFAVEDVSVEVYDTSGSLVASRTMAAGEYWDLSLSNAVYHVISTGRIAMETVSGSGYTTVPSVEGKGVGHRFYFATYSWYTGAFAVFAYQDADVEVYDLDSGSLLYSQHVNQGDYWWQTGVGTRRLRLESTGDVEVWAGDTEGGSGIECLGDDLSFAGGDGGREYYLHSLMDGSVIFAPFDNTTVNVDGTIYHLDKDEYLHLSGCCYFRHIVSSKPVLIQTLGRDSAWNDLGTYLGGVVVRGGSESSWLTTDPVTGTVPAWNVQPVTVIFDAGAVNQPGTYTATLRVSSNDPVTPTVTVPVTMSVPPHPDMGNLWGTVGDCRTDDPVGATLFAQGDPYTFTTSSDPATGLYSLWAFSGTYTLDVFAEGYVTRTIPVTITAGTTTTLPICLVRNEPVMQLSPTSLAETLFVGEMATQTMTISNIGPVSLDYSLVISPEVGYTYLDSDAPIGPAFDWIEIIGGSPGPSGDDAYGGPYDIGFSFNFYGQTNSQFYVSTNGFLSFGGGSSDRYNTPLPDAKSPNNTVYALWDDLVAPSGSIRYQTFGTAPHRYLVVEFAGVYPYGTTDYQYFEIILYEGSNDIVLQYHSVPGAGDGRSASVGLENADGTKGLEYLYDGNPSDNLLHNNLVIRMFQQMATGPGGFCTTVSGQSDHTSGDLDDTYADPHRLLGSIYLWAYSSDNDTLNAVVTAYNTHTDNWDTLYSGSGGSRLLLDQEFDSLVYSQVRVQLDDTEGDDTIYYDYSFDWCSLGDEFWLIVEPVTGTVPGYSAVPVSVTFDATATPPDEYAAQLIVDSNDYLSPTVSVPTALTVNGRADGAWVVGEVTDERTGEPLEATVTGRGDFAFSDTTDPRTGGYTLWLAEGGWTVEAAAAGYLTETTSIITLTAGTVITQDFALRRNAPVLAVTPTVLSAVPLFAQQVTRVLTISNEGPAPLDFEISKAASGFTSTIRADYLPDALRQLADQVPLGGSTSVLLAVADSSYGNTVRNWLAAYPDLDPVDLFYAYNGTPTLDELLAYDVVLVWGNNCYSDRYAMGDVLADYLDAGGRVIVSVFNWYSESQCYFLSGRFVSDGYSPFVTENSGNRSYWASLGGYDASHPIMEGVTAVSAYYREYVSLDPEADLVASWDDGEEFIATKGNVVAINAFPGSNWNGDLQDLFHNSILYLKALGEADWLKTDPITGTVPAWSCQPVTVTFDAAAVNQPGTYTVTLEVDSNDPVVPTAMVEVTMTLACPTCGQVEGAVTDHRTRQPLEATIFAQGPGYTLTVETDRDTGWYTLWGISGTHVLTITSAGYLTQTDTVPIVAGVVITRNFALIYNAPAMEVRPTLLTETLLVGEVATQTMAISNVGPLPLDFSLGTRQGGSKISVLIAAADWNASWFRSYLVAYPDLNPVDLFDSQYGTPTLEQLQQYDVVLVWGNSCYSDRYAMGDVLADYLDAGGRVIVSVFNWYNEWQCYYVSGRFVSGGYSPFVTENIGNHYNWASLGVYDLSHPIMAEVTDVSAYYRDYVSLAAGATWVASWDDGEEFIATKGDVVAINAYPGSGWSDDLPDLFHNSILYLAAGVEWLTTDPLTGTVSAFSALPVTVTFEATSTPPKVYTATLHVTGNDPVTSTVNVPVTMTVNSRPNEALVVGTVTDADTGDPLEATVTGRGAFTFRDVTEPTTDTYKLYLAEGLWTVEATAKGYLTTTVEISLTAGVTHTLDFSLPLNIPRLAVAPRQLTATLPLGDVVTRTFTISNEGPAPLRFELYELPGLHTLSFAEHPSIPTVEVPEGTTSNDSDAFPVVQSESWVQGNPVLVIQDQYPWGYDAVQRILSANGIPYDQVGSSSIPSIDLTSYKLVIIPSVQGSSFYNTYNSYLSKFEAYVQQGGVLELHATTYSGTSPRPLLPGGGSNDWNGQNYNYVVRPDHPLVNGVSNPFYGSYASHNSFSNIQPDATVIATAGSSTGGPPTLIEYRLGRGLVVASGQTLEFGWGNGQEAGIILQNAIPYCYSFEAYGEIPWLSAQPIAGTIPGYNSSSITVTLDAHQVPLAGVYTATIVISSTDPVSPLMSVWVTMTAESCPSCGQLVGTVTDGETGDPVEATIWADEVPVSTDPSTGNYWLWLKPGTYTVTASAEGYLPMTATITITAQTITTQDFPLAPDVPRVQVAPSSLSTNPIFGEVVTRTLFITNTGTQPLAFWIREMKGRFEPIESSPFWAQMVLPAERIDPQILEEIGASEDGRARFFVLLQEQADPSLAYAIEDWNERGQFVLDALRETASRSQADLLNYLDTQVQVGRVTGYQSHYIINALLVTAGEDVLYEIAARPEVAALRAERVYPVPEPMPGVEEPTIDAAEWNIAQIRANDVWSDFGATGEGVVVANIDTGVRYTHEALRGQYRGNLGGGAFDHNYNWWDPDMVYNQPTDNNGHGSHTMGTMVGDDGGANQIGVAPGARWIAAQGCDSSSCSESDLISSAEWILAPWDLTGDKTKADPSKRPHVVNNSWGGGGCDTWYAAYVDAWRAAGIFPAFSAGNNGPGCNTMGSPGDLPQSFASGATYSNDNIADFSSRGPSCWGEVKPDVSAPGVNVRSAYRYDDSSYYTMSGTSMASPHSAGTVALLWSAYPGLIGDVDFTEEVIMGTAFGIADDQCGDPDPPNNVYGWGRIDAYEAVSQAEAEVAWLEEIPSSDVVAPGEMNTVAVVFTSGLGQPGTDSAYLRVGTNARFTPQVLVPVTMTVALSPDAGRLEGWVTDLRTGDPLAAYMEVEGGYSPDTDPDTGLYSGWYISGTYTATISAAGYLSQTAEITITAGVTATQDFALMPNAPWVEVTPTAISETVPYTATVTQVLTITNQGPVATEFEIMEMDLGFQSKISIPASDGNFPRGSDPLSIERAPSAALPVNAPAASPLGQILGAQAYAVNLFDDSLYEFPDIDVPGFWNLVGTVSPSAFYAGDLAGSDFGQVYVVDNDSQQLYAIDTATGAGTIIGPCVPNPGQTWTGMAYDSTTGVMYGSATDGATATLFTIALDTGTTTVVADIANAPYNIDIAIDASGQMYGHDISFDSLIAIDKATGATTVIGSTGFDANYAQGMEFDEEANTLYLAAYNNATGVGELRIADTSTGATTPIGQFPGGAEVDALSIATGGGGDVPWLSEEPITGTVSAYSSQVVTVTLDATAVDDFGAYEATLSVETDDPLESPPVLVTMTVPVDPNMGKVQGTVSDARTGDPLEATLVTAGDTYSRTTDAETGFYRMWLISGAHTISVTSGGYLTRTAEVTIVAGTTITQDFGLIPNAPWIDLSPPSIFEVVPYSGTATVPLTISNAGPVTLTFDIREMKSAAAALTMPLAVEEGIDPLILQEMAASEDGQARFFVLLTEQADLSPAYAIADWTERGQFVLDVLRETAHRSQADLLSYLDTQVQVGRVTEYQSYYIINALLVEAGEDVLYEIAARPEVAALRAERVYPVPEPMPGVEEPTVDAVEWNIAQIRANDVWSDLGVSGEGTVVANIDTGVLYTHDALEGQYRGNLGGGAFDHNYNWWDPDMVYNQPTDNNGHGSHTMGTMVGDDGGANQIGVVPDAKWIAAQGCDTSSCSESDLISSAEWILAPWDLTGNRDTADPSKRPHVVNNSWGGGGCDTWYAPYVDAWRAAGIFPAFSAGNSGSGCSSMGSPGDLPQSFASGATDSSDTIAYFSSRGPSCWGETKPEVSAPGVNVRSSVNGSDSAYSSYNGTSMASPHSAALAALMWSANPGLIGDVDFTEEVIMVTAFGIANGQCGDSGPPNNVYGWGRIDAYEAVLEVAAMDLVPWLTVVPTTGMVSGYSSQVISVHLDARMVPEPDVYRARLRVVSNDTLSQTVNVPVTMSVRLPLAPPAGLVVTASGRITTPVEVIGTDVQLSWDEVAQATSYRVYTSTSRFAPWPDGWTLLTTTADTDYVHWGAGVYTGSMYYLVTALSGGDESPPSTMGAKTTLAFNYNTDKSNVNWIGLPPDSPYARASDIVVAIEEGTGNGTNTKIDKVCLWDAANQVSICYGYSKFLERWIGTDFAIEPGAGLYLNVTSSFRWTHTYLAPAPGVAAQPGTPLRFDHNLDKANVNWISLPYDGLYTRASDVVADIEGEAGASSKINKVMLWDAAHQVAVVYGYSQLLHRWIGTDFVIQPGDGIALNVTADFTWAPKVGGALPTP